MVFRPGVKKLLWALIYAALPNADCHLHDIIKGMDVSSGGTVLILSRFYMLSSYDAGLTWKLLAIPHAITGIDRNEIIMSPAFDEDGVVFFGGKYRSKDGGENWQKIKLDKEQQLSPVEESCAKTHKDGMAFHPHYNHKIPKNRRRMVMMAVLNDHRRPKIRVSVERNVFRNVQLSRSMEKILGKGKCPMLATMGNVTYLATQSMAVFGTVDFGESWSVVLPAQANEENVMQLQVDQTSAQGGHEATTLLLVTKNNVYQVKPNLKKLIPLKFSSAMLVPIVLPDSLPVGHPINVVATHRGPGEESSTFISRTRCPSPTWKLCKDTRNDNVLISHNITEHTWGTLEIIDWFALDRGGEPASHWKIPEFSDIKGVTGTPRVYIGTYSGIFRSDDGGDSWLELDTIANAATTLSISPAPVNGGSFARVTTCTYSGGCFFGEVNLMNVGNDESLHVGDMVPQICKMELDDVNNWSVAVDSPSFEIDHISLRIVGIKTDDRYTQIERSMNDFATVTIPLKTQIDAATCERTGKCSPSTPVLRVIKFSPNFEEDKTVYIAGVQGLWRSTDTGLTFKKFSRIPRAAIGERCSNCDKATGWTGRDIVLLSFSPGFARDGTMVALSQTSSSKEDSYKRYISVSTDRGKTWTDMVGTKSEEEHRYWTSAVITAGPGAPQGLTVVATQHAEKIDQIYINQASEAPYNNTKWAILKAPKQVGVGLEHGGYSGYGIALLPNRELIVSLWGGGMVVGKINKAETELQNIRNYDTPHFGGDSNLAASANEKKLNEQVMVSPDKRHKGAIFGVSKQDIYASVDEGATWGKVLSIPFRLPRSGSFKHLRYNAEIEERKEAKREERKEARIKEKREERKPPKKKKNNARRRRRKKRGW